MIGLDTNAILRLALDDDADQRRRVIALLSKSPREVFSINPIVLAEAAWTLEKKLKRDRARVAAFLEQTLDTEGFQVQFEAATWQALDDYRQGKADFADYLLARINLDLGCRTTFTFDIDALDGEAFSAIP